MKSETLGPGTLEAEVTNISRHGFWIWLGDREVFLPFERFPWFRDATVAGIVRLERPQPFHLYWPDLDVDLEVDSIDHPEDPRFLAIIEEGRAQIRAGKTLSLDEMKKAVLR